MERENELRAGLALLADRDRLSVVEGAAGVGKTTSLAGYLEEAAAAGQRVAVVAPTGAAAIVAATQTGVEASTVDSLLGRYGWDKNTAGGWVWVEPGRRPLEPLPAASRLVVDEAGMVSQDAARALVTLAGACGWPVRVQGDSFQFSAVGVVTGEALATAPRGEWASETISEGDIVATRVNGVDEAGHRYRVRRPRGQSQRGCPACRRGHGPSLFLCRLDPRPLHQPGRDPGPRWGPGLARAQVEAILSQPGADTGWRAADLTAAADRQRMGDLVDMPSRHVPAIDAGQAADGAAQFAWDAAWPDEVRDPHLFDRALAYVDELQRERVIEADRQQANLEQLRGSLEKAVAASRRAREQW